MAIRQCIELGYHRSTSRLGANHLNPLQAELRKRAFWCSYDLDRSVGMTLGRPFGIADGEIDIEVQSVTCTGSCTTDMSASCRAILTTASSRPEI